jgi:hypothetical protein
LKEFLMARTQLLEAAAGLASQLPDGPLTLAPDNRVVALLASLGQLRRTIDSIGVELAAELERRSAVADTSVARSLGERSPAVAIARLTGIDPSEAQDWIAAGAATTPRLSLSGELLPPRYEALAHTLDAAAITPRAARLVAETLDAVNDRCTVTELAELEAVVLDYAPELTTRELAKLCRQVIERYDPDGAEPREERLRAQAGVTVIHGRDGLVTWIVKMHPEAAGFVTTAIDARTSPRRQPSFADGDAVDTDDRTPAQKRLDALMSIARDSLARDDGQVAGTAVTMVVTMTLESLISGVGSAAIDGVDAPLSARTARRLAADSLLIPVVLGSGSEPLDVGRASRLYTEPQRRALAVRDGGCIWPGCNAPPGWCEVAHLVPWSHGGPTDLANGALMCRFHHARFDNDGWRLTWQGTTRVLIPPPWVDAAQTPRRAGRLPRVA